MKKIFATLSTAAAFFAAYSIGFAADVNDSYATGHGFDSSALTDYKTGFVGIINGILVPSLMALAFIVFLYGIFKYFILNGDSDEERAKGRQFALWGIVGFVVITSMWGLVNLVKDTLSLGNTPTRLEQYPTLPTK